MTPALTLVLVLALETGYQERDLDIGAVELPDPAKRLSESEVETRSFVELAILRNHVFARHGRSFSKPWVMSFFKKQPWYKHNPAFKDAMLTEVDRANLGVLSSAQTRVPPDQLRLRRNTVFARHGRIFKSADLQAHFKKQPWYKPNAKFAITSLSDRDHLEVEIIQSLEAKAEAVKGLDQWAPGRRLSKKSIQDASEWDLANLAMRMVEKLQLKGFAELCDGPVFMLNIDESACEMWKKNTRDLKKLPKVDKKTWADVERRLAELMVTLDHPHFDECEGLECEYDDKNMKAFNRCVAACESRQEAELKAHEAEQKKRLAATKRGKHPRGPALMSELMSVLASSAA